MLTDLEHLVAIHGYRSCLVRHSGITSPAAGVNPRCPGVAGVDGLVDGCPRAAGVDDLVAGCPGATEVDGLVAGSAFACSLGADMMMQRNRINLRFLDQLVLLCIPT